MNERAVVMKGAFFESIVFYRGDSLTEDLTPNHGTKFPLPFPPGSGLWVWEGEYVTPGEP